MNKPAMAELLGKGRDIGGDTAFHIKHLEWQIKQKTQQKTELESQRQSTPETVEQTLQLNREIKRLEQQKQIVVDLARQVKDIYRRNAEVKFLAARIDRDGVVPKPGRLSYTDQALFRAILLSTGNLEVQKANVGVEGYKTEMIDSITERVGDDKVREEVRGLSEVTSK